MPTVNLNGQVFKTGIAGLENVSATIRRSDGVGGSAFSFTGELTFYGDAYNIVRDLILNAAVPHLVKIPISIYSDQCPSSPFVGYVEGGSVEWCEISADGVPCSAKAQVIDGSTVAENLACVKNTIIWAKLTKKGYQTISEGEDTYRKSRYITCCIEFRPRALAEMLMIWYLTQRTILLPIIFGFYLIVGVINLIIAAVNTIPLIPNISPLNFDGNDDTGAFQEFLGFLDYSADLVTGCGVKHKAPFIHSYIQNVCDVCGLTLSSSILEPGGTYHNLMRLDAPAYHSKVDAGAAAIEQAYNDNKPNLNGAQFLDEMRTNLNWEWWLDGNTLRVEPLGKVSGLVWFEQGDGTVIKSFCIQTTDETVKAYGVYEYTLDAVDVGSNEVKKDWGAVNDWNTPPNDVQRGALERTLPYSAALFRKDNQGDSVLPIDKPLYNNSIAFPTLSNFPNALILSKGVTSQPKLLMYDGLSLQDNARVERWNAGNGKWDYNYRMWLRKTHPGGETLYSNSFDATDNPRNADILLRSFTMEICLTCELLSTAVEARLLKASVNGVMKTGKIEEITINYGAFTASISGKI